MTPEIAIKIMTDEELYIRDYNWFEDRETKRGELGIIRKGDEWQIYVTEEERGSLVNTVSYSDLSEALYHFIDRMQAGKFLVERFWEERDEEAKQVSEEDYLWRLEFRKKDIKKKKAEWLACKDRIYEVMEQQ